MSRSHRACFSYSDFTQRIIELDASGATPRHGLAKVALDMLPLELATEAGKHVRAGIYGDPDQRQAPQTTAVALEAVDEAESAALVLDVSRVAGASAPELEMIPLVEVSAASTPRLSESLRAVDASGLPLEPAVTGDIGAVATSSSSAELLSAASLLPQPADVMVSGKSGAGFSV